MDNNKVEKGVVPAFDINKDAQTVGTLSGFKMTDNGHQVYSPINKPTPEEIGGVASYTAPLTGEGASALLVCSLGANVGYGSSANTFFLSGGNNAGVPNQGIYKVSLSSRGYSGTGPLPENLCSITSLDGGDDVGIGFTLLRNGAELEFWVTRPTYSTVMTATPLLMEPLNPVTFKMTPALSVPSATDSLVIGITRTYTGRYKPTHVDVGAAPTGYGLGEASPGELGGDKNLNTLRYNGFRTYNQDAGDVGAPSAYGTALDFGHKENGENYTGWAGQLFLGNNGSLWSRVNQVAGTFVGSAWERFYTTASPPTAVETGAITKTGDSGVGAISFQSGLKGSVDLPDMGSIRYRDTGSWLHTYARGDSLVFGHGQSGENEFARMDAGTGAFHTTGDQISQGAQISTSPDNGATIAITAPNGQDPYLAFKGQGMANPEVGIRFGNQEFISSRRVASTIRVPDAHGIRFSDNSNFAGVNYSAGMDANNGVFAIKQFNGNAWTRDVFVTDPAGNNSIKGSNLTIDSRTIIGGDVLVAGAGIISGGEMRIERGTNPLWELHAPGKQSFMGYVPDTGGLVLGTSTGGGAMVNQAAHIKPVSSDFQGRINVTTNQNRYWTSLGTSAFHNTQTDVAEGALQGLVTGRYHYPGYYGMEFGLGSLHYPNSGECANTLFCTDGRDYTRYWAFKNNGALVTPDNQWAIEPNGHEWATGYGNQYLHQWCIASFAPISDSKLKRNIKPSTKSALENISKIQFHSYDWKEEGFTKDNKSVEVGILAQEMEAIDPSYAKDINTYKEDGVTVDTSVKSLDVTNLLALALKANQELLQRIEALEAKLETM